MTTSRDLIKSIMDEDFVAAKEITKNLVFAAVADELELARQEVGANLFGCTDCEEMNEGQMSANRYGGGKKFDWSKPHPSNAPKKKVNKDYDKDGRVEPAKDEVLGSRINAAVKAGNLTPAQAAKTKNKGKYR